MQPSPHTPGDLLHDFGGDGPVIHLAHANGFPPGAYAPLAEALTNPEATDAGPSYHVVALPARPLWPGAEPESAPTWHTLVDDLAHGLCESNFEGIIGVGHSLGGVCTLLAAVRRPELFRAVVLIDPVILHPILLWGLRLMRWLGLRERQPLVQGALRRRQTWPSRRACFEHYRGKAFFADWSDESLWAYVKAGTRPMEHGGVKLAYPPRWEAHIFATTPTDVWRYVPRLRTPALIIRGENSETFRPAAQKRVARLIPQAQFHVISEAGHLVPLERPAETGAVVRSFLARNARPW